MYSTGSAALIANISSKGFGSNPAVNASGVVIANLALPAASVSGGTISWSGASATLTSAGAGAFGGFYSAGDALDPVSFTFPLGAEVPCDATTSNALAATGGTTPDATIWLGLGMLVLGAGLVALRRRQSWCVRGWDNGRMTESTRHSIETAQVRRSPRYAIFFALGAALGILVALILTFAFDGTAEKSPATQVLYSSSQVFGFLCLACIPIGLALGGLVALLLDRRFARRTREVRVDHERVEVQHPDD